jgi:hypothetical protein
MGVVLVVVTATTALAGHMPSGVKSYTGCLVPNDGVIIKIKEGNAPRSACTGGQVEAHFSGGDITKISVTGALSGGGDNGEVTIGLKTEFTLPTGCSNGQVAKWNGTGWACAPDNNTTYSAGTGLDLSGANAFSIEPEYRVKNTPDCGSGQFATGFSDTGTIQCSAPASSVLAGNGKQEEPGYSRGAEIPDDAAWHTYASVSVGTGDYVLMGKGALHRGDDDLLFASRDGLACRLALGALEVDRVGFRPKDNEPESYGFSLTGTVVATSGGQIVLQCLAEPDADLAEVSFARVVALKIG